MSSNSAKTAVREASIVLPTYNRQRVLELTLPSYLKQQRVLEVIVVDDASTDCTSHLLQELARHEPRLAVISHSRRRGVAAARNSGIDVAKGDVILFGEDDVVLDDAYSARLLSCLNSSGADAAAGRIIYLRPGQTTRPTRDLPQPAGNHSPLPTVRSALSHGGFPSPTVDCDVSFLHALAAIRRSVFSTIRFDESYGGNGWREEMDFFVQARTNGYRLRMCVSALCFHLARNDIGQGGGNHTLPAIGRGYWKVRNTYRFLRKHRSFLHESEGMDMWPGAMTLLYLGGLLRESLAARCHGRVAR